MSSVELFCHETKERFNIEWEFEDEVDCPLCGNTHEIEWDYADEYSSIAVWTLVANEPR